MLRHSAKHQARTAPSPPLAAVASRMRSGPFGNDGPHLGVARGESEWRCRHAAVHCAEVHESVFAEHEDRWILGLRGLAVTKISVDYQLSLLLGSVSWVVLEGPCGLSQGSAGKDHPQEMLDPGRQDIAAALALFGAKVMSAVAFKTGSLLLVFDNGLHLNCRSDPSFEAWQMTGPGGWRFVSLPGGELAVWSGTEATERDEDG